MGRIVTFAEFLKLDEREAQHVTVITLDEEEQEAYVTEVDTRGAGDRRELDEL